MINVGRAQTDPRRFATCLPRKTNRYGIKSWLSESQYLTVCQHIQTGVWDQLGLINFSLTSFLNAIPLCPTCHCQFDKAIDPGLVFVPVDVEYFIEFELRDRERRRKAAEEGLTAARRVPTSEMFKAHEVQKGIIEADAIGGLYTPIFLKPYLHEGLVPAEFMQIFSKPKPWHGSPLASLRRSFQILGSARLRSVERKTRIDLERLRTLYFYLDVDDGPWSELSCPVVPRDEPDDKRKKRRIDDTAPGKNEPSKRRGPGAGNGMGSQGQGKATYCSVQRQGAYHDWNLGPHMSTEDAIHLFAPVIARSV